ncbi:MAG: T9SS type A sorting domain-containing protein [Flavobacteriales bacterium]|nr:T9SS type A sorting domain-containing protein [Flavobacteriales bacterium]
MPRHLLLALACTLALAATAQPTWRFHLAFEDGTGARDTIWFIFDTTATNGTGLVDETLGEGAVAMDPNLFSVWLLNPAYDSTKTVAIPYTYFPYISVEVQAFNYTFPMIWRWDTALFRLPWLPAPGFPYDGGTMDSDYFFFLGSNDFWGHSFILGWTDSTVVDPWVTSFVFPTVVNLGLDLHSGLNELYNKDGLVPVPNPGRDRIELHDTQGIQEVQVWSLDGRLCKVQQGQGSSMVVDVAALPSGSYLLRILRADGTWRPVRWVKAEGL